MPPVVARPTQGASLDIPYANGLAQLRRRGPVELFPPWCSQRSMLTMTLSYQDQASAWPDDSQIGLMRHDQPNPEWTIPLQQLAGTPEPYGARHENVSARLMHHVCSFTVFVWAVQGSTARHEKELPPEPPHHDESRGCTDHHLGPVRPAPRRPRLRKGRRCSDLCNR